MATGLVWYDGFDDTTAITDSYINGGGSITAAAVRTGTNGYRRGNDDDITRVWGGASNHMIVGVAVNIVDYPVGGNTPILCLMEGGTFHVQVHIDASGLMYVSRNGTVLSSTYFMLEVQWFYLEIDAVISDTGSFDVYIDGILIPELSAASVDTQNGGTGNCDRVRLGYHTNSSADIDYDDFYIIDGSVSGSVPLGDCRVGYLPPSGAGDDADWTPLAGANYENVDETPRDEDTTYNESNVVDDQDTFALTNVPESGVTVFGVAHIMRARKVDAGARTLRGLLKSGGGTTVEQDEVGLGTSYTTFFQHNEDVPGGSGWTTGDVDALKCGYKIET